MSVQIWGTESKLLFIGRNKRFILILRISFVTDIRIYVIILIFLKFGNELLTSLQKTNTFRFPSVYDK